MQTLTPKALADEWARRKARPVYYLCGEETALKEAKLLKLEAAFRPEPFNFSVRDAELADLDQALDEACTAPMLAEVRFVVLRRVEKLKKEPLKRLLAYLENPCPSACLVLLADWPREKQDPIPGALGRDCALVEFKPLTGAEAAERVNSALLARGVKAGGEALDLLVDLLGTDIATLDGETEKIALFMHGRERLFSPEDALALAGFARAQSPYELSNAVCGRQPAAAAAAVNRMLLSRALERMLKVKRLAAAGEGQGASYQAGMSPGQFYAAQRDADRFTDEKLVRSLRRCLEVEELLKSSSKRDPSILLRQLAQEITAAK